MFQILSDRIMNTIGLQKYEIDGNVVHLYFEYVSFKDIVFILSNTFTYRVHYRTVAFISKPYL